MGLRVSGWAASENQIYENLIQEALFRTRCCIPCVIQSYDAEENTVEAQPTVRERIILEDNTIKYVDIPMLLDVPVAFPGTKNASIRFPLEKGDECLVVFSDLSIDNFWEVGGVQNPVEVRRHDLSDGIAIPCCISKKFKKKNNANMNIEYKGVKIEIDGSDATFTCNQGSVKMSTLVQLATHTHIDSNGGNTSTPIFT